MKIAKGFDSFTRDRTVRFEECGVATYLTHIFKPETDAVQVRYMQLGPWGEVLPHFHIADQYQVFVNGSGTFGKSVVGPLSVHYADRYTPYGPIRINGEGLSWYTVRLAKDPGAAYLPEARPLQVERPGRTITHSAELPPLLDSRRQITVMERHPDGVGARLEVVPAGLSVSLAAPEGIGGEIHILLRGSIEAAGDSWSRQTCLHLSPGDSWSGKAGAGGALVLVLGFRTGADKVDPAVLARASELEISKRIAAAKLEPAM